MASENKGGRITVNLILLGERWKSPYMHSTLFRFFSSILGFRLWVFQGRKRAQFVSKPD